MTMHVLALDGSTHDISISVAAVEAGELRPLFNGALDLPSPAAEPSPRIVLSCVVADAVRAAGLTLNDVQLWAVGCGPGRGEWIEHSVDFMRRIAAGTGRPLTLLSSLEAIAIEAFRSSPSLGSVVVPIVESSREDRFFAGAYRMPSRAAELEVVVPDAEYSLAELRAALVTAKQTKRGDQLVGMSLAMAPTWYGAGAGYFEVAAELTGLLTSLPETSTPIFDPSALMLGYAACCRTALH